MRIAAIDIGTNSVHMIVVRVRTDLSFEVIDREKAMVRLGAGGLDGKALTTEAMGATRRAGEWGSTAGGRRRVGDALRGTLVGPTPQRLTIPARGRWSRRNVRPATNDLIAGRSVCYHYRHLLCF